jgi:hypothetical protein
MNNQLTVITPIGPDHVDKFEHCRASVEAQTVAVEHRWQIDHDRRGPGWLRNRLLEKVATKYVTFLDADDWLQPDFAEKMLTVIKPNRYTYCDWYQTGEIKTAPDTGNAWCNGTFHLITSVIPTARALALGGFNEQMAGMEDTEFYIRLCLQNVCGIRVPFPLVHYRADGGRSQAIHDSGEVDRLQEHIKAQYGGYIMSCCGGVVHQNTGPSGEKQPGDVLAQAMWKGNRQEHGRHTGRMYPRTSYPKMTWVDPRDVAAAPQHWREVVEYQFDKPPEPPEEETPGGVAALMTEMQAIGIYNAAKPSVITPAVRPNTRKVLRLSKTVDYPIFVSPRKEYGSYTDFWRLVELSGFERRYNDEVDLSNAEQTYVFVSPEGIPDCSGAQAHTIFWQLEYAGDYTEQENRHTVDRVWSSDAHHAKQNGYQFVFFGSHPGLNPTGKRGGGQPYDLTMLAYMTPRRQTIKEQLSQYEWPPLYPGHGVERHNILANTPIMVYVHQHDTPAIAPLRFALAAAYRMLMISENVPDKQGYHQLGWFVDYGYLPSVITSIIEGKMEHQDADGIANKMYNHLCIEHTFHNEVMGALK